MEMVAASKMRKAQDECVQRVHTVTRFVISPLTCRKPTQKYTHPFMVQQDQAKKLAIVVTTDKGLVRWFEHQRLRLVT